MRSIRLAGAVVAGCCLIAGLVPATVTAAPTADVHGGLFSGNRANSERVLDTRTGLGGRLGAVAAGHTVTFVAVKPQAHGRAAAAILNVTVPGSAPDGSLSVYPSGTTWDRRVTMTLTGGGTVQQQLTVRLGADGGVTIRNNAARPVQLVVEVQGSYSSGTPDNAGAFAALSSRILDTRAGSPLAPGHRLTVTLPGRGGIPAGGASAVVLNIAVLSAHATGLLSIKDADGKDMTPHLRFLGQARPQTMQTERVVMLGRGGTLAFSQSSSSSVHLVLDVAGYFLPGTGLAIGSYVPMAPQPLRYGARTSPSAQLVLRGRTAIAVPVPVPALEEFAYNIVVSSDRPAQPTLLGLYQAALPWNGSPTVSSSASRQPSELTVQAGLTDYVDYVVLRNLYDAPQTLLHAWVTGYYWFPYGT
ncbi:MAG: hypothetical protein JO144_10115 [Actinobacteria bacterium]|nr:hypothetical protein [Actinomycetota bacterium]